jgi:hypothetical protein
LDEQTDASDGNFSPNTQEFRLPPCRSGRRGGRKRKRRRTGSRSRSRRRRGRRRRRRRRRGAKEKLGSPIHPTTTRRQSWFVFKITPEFLERQGNPI